MDSIDYPICGDCKHYKICAAMNGIKFNEFACQGYEEKLIYTHLLK